MNKVIIIGAGPSGVSAALYLKRANIDVTVISLENSSLLLAHKIDNYYGVNLSGEELFYNGLKQLKDFDIPLYKEEVVGLSYSDKFEVITKENTYKADYVIMASGAYRNTPRIKNYKEYEAKGLSYCAVCDGFFYRKKKIAVIGNASYALHEAEYLNNLTDDLYILSDGNEIKDEALRNFRLIEDKIDSIYGDNKVEGIKFTNGNTLELDGIFIALGSAGSVDLARKLGALVDNNKIETDNNMMTNIPNLYAIGDTTKGLMQVAKAVNDGAICANDIIKKTRK